MILRALHVRGKLDISGQETHEGENEFLRISLKPGDVVEIGDRFRKYVNIDLAISKGLLEVVSYDSAPGSEVVNAELDGLSGGTIDLASRLKFKQEPVVAPNGSLKTFTLPNSEKYVSNSINVYLNGQQLNQCDYSEDAGRKTITLDVSVPAPRTGESIRLDYIKDTTA